MSDAPRLIVLFDIDLTLIDYPFNEETVSGALDAATGVPGLLKRLDWRGTTDRWLADEGARLTGGDGELLYERLAEAYTRILGESLATLRSSVLPGSAGLLESLASEHNAVLGISTGNTRRNAILKLEHAELAGYFDPLRGGFGDDLDDRADIVRAAGRGPAGGGGRYGARYHGCAGVGGRGDWRGDGGEHGGGVGGGGGDGGAAWPRRPGRGAGGDPREMRTAQPA